MDDDDETTTKDTPSLQVTLNTQVTPALVASPKTEFFKKDINRAVAQMLEKSSYVVGCVAWVTEYQILRAMSKQVGVCLIVQRETYLVRKDKRDDWRIRLKATYAKLPHFPFHSLTTKDPMQMAVFKQIAKEQKEKAMAVRYMGKQQTRRVQNRQHAKTPAVEDQMAVEKQGVEPEDASMMHNKFLVFFNASGQPFAAWMGSSNLTKNAENSLENAVIFHDVETAKYYFNLFLELLPHSYALAMPS